MALLVLIVTTGLVSVISFFASQVDVPTFLRDGYESVLLSYPEDLQISLSSTGVSVNQKLPYRVPLPATIIEETDDADVRFLVAFVANEQMKTLPDFWEYEALAVVTETTLYLRQDEGQVTMQDLSEVLQDVEEPVVIDRALLSSVPIEDIASFWMFQPSFYVPAIFVVGLVFLYPALLTLLAVMLLFWSLVLWIVLKCFSRTRGLSFGKTYQIGVHAYTPVYLLGFLFSELQGITAFLLFQVFATAMTVTGTQKKRVPAPVLPAKSSPAFVRKSKPAKKAVAKKKPVRKTTAKR
jgi:hypothetical protein